ncbi:hypothetical protein [Planktothrix pseudagardhii]|uniref:Uncharacterized protein n=1 Tax=Planktothrix pseudagardhii TaxID=132604 RepID=A0A9W4GAW1_9CYAN|nr:hypothetical protein [Planktothrix pseudagardhii]CAD5982025.1 hypothetical protein NO713_04921 [Planktothrix pseudagardhii]
MSEWFQQKLPNMNCFCHESGEPIADPHNSRNSSYIEQPTTNERNYPEYLDDENIQENKDESDQFCNQLNKPKKLTPKDTMEFLCEPDPWSLDGTPRCNSGYCEDSIYDLDDQND